MSRPPRRGLAASGARRRRAAGDRRRLRGRLDGAGAPSSGTDAFARGHLAATASATRARLAADTHDFEARYLDGLIGPLPEAEELYIERSPLSHPERFRVPLLLLQGAEDPVVPPAQSEAIRDALAAHGVPHAYVVYEGEGHGFRRAETVDRRARDGARVPRRGVRLRHPGRAARSTLS